MGFRIDLEGFGAFDIGNTRCIMGYSDGAIAFDLVIFSI